MNKEQLETRIKELTVLIEEASGNVQKLVDEQAAFTKMLEDLNKPKLSHAQMDQVQHVVESACETFDMEIDECDYNIEIDYDNRVVVSDFDWSRCQEELTQRIMDRLEKVFAVGEDEE
jgi:uncharacterized protein YpuA (DUF1002 family)